ncbi:hypothetical protein M501DRAFT_989176 [Patellaria atrata CBS 101060]|uniref:PXA domain-containing protein n=1 Tax=Patellaria atrata CBS 101060 TaxID=1346257 RepID=A0A9P4S2Y7_9PEZI|nr:hypothetical protein M501DRAFT_989176 [Patellaria atrata CBS 101060]
MEEQESAAQLQELEQTPEPTAATGEPKVLLEEAKDAIKTLPDNAQNIQATVQSVTNHALGFLSTASNETLGACLVGLSATTYLVLGRVGLVLIGVVGGVVLHASWEGSTADVAEKSKEEKRRKEVGVDVLHRVLDWRTKAPETVDGSGDGVGSFTSSLHTRKQLDYSEFKPETAAALNDLTDAVIRDYVRWWYTPVLPSEELFPTSSRKTLTAFILSISNHLSRKRPADTFLDFLANSSSIVVVFLNELASALTALPSAAAPEAVATYLISKPDSSLSQILDRKNQERKLDIVAEDVLQTYLDSKTYNCEPARVFLREVLAKLILEKTVQSCSKADWVNGWIVYLLEEGEPEIMNVIDTGVSGECGEQLQNVKKQMIAHDENASAEAKRTEEKVQQHKRVVSKAQEAMDEAMKEAQRLTQLIAEEDAKRQREQGSVNASVSDLSEVTTQGMATPTSSQSDINGESDMATSRNMSTESFGNVLTERTNGSSSTLPSINTSTTPAPVSASAPQRAVPTPFTSFDQLIPQLPTALLGEDEKPTKEPLTLSNATLSIFDDSMPGEKGVIRSKPNVDYLIQIEPRSSHHPGWMIARKYADFETLHEIIKRLSVISGVGFTETHPTLPAWKGHTKASLRGELERYLNDAVKFKPLAESEGLKRFLEKDQGLRSSPHASNKGGFPGIGWPTPSAFENMGKGMMDALTKAPKEVAGGGKALFGGVTSVLGGVGSIGQRKQSVNSGSRSRSSTSTTATTPKSGHIRVDSTPVGLSLNRKSQDGLTSQESLRLSPIVDQQPAPIPQMDRKPSYNPEVEAERVPRLSSSSKASLHARSAKSSREPSRASSIRESLDELSPTMGGDQILNLPPLPTDISDDYGSPATSSPLRNVRNSEEISRVLKISSRKQSEADIPSVPTLPPRPFENNVPTSPPKHPKRSLPKLPLSEDETKNVVELLFAVINELYTLSSAWNIRRTLLTAAKTYLLRPGNPQLESIRVLLQSSVLDANTSDPGLAAHIKLLRANALPTADELETWPPPLAEREREALRVKARRLLMERGVPQALMSVMGQAASGEALGKVFDCLQVEEVARGLVFGLLLQAVRAVTQ